MCHGKFSCLFIVRKILQLIYNTCKHIFVHKNSKFFLHEYIDFFPEFLHLLHNQPLRGLSSLFNSFNILPI